MLEFINLSAAEGTPEFLASSNGLLCLQSQSQSDVEARTTFDAKGTTPYPGLIDLQCNGAFGHDFTASPETLWEVGAQLPRFGVTAFLPTIITSPFSHIEAAIAAFKSGPPGSFRGAIPLGLHLEGPFLNPCRAGAHDATHLRSPNARDIELLTRENGVVMVTLAPEVDGCMDLIKTLNDRGILVSVGHSNANVQQATEAFEAGARYATHLFNASSPMHHRDPGVPGAALIHDRVVVGVIADGVHLHEKTVRLIHDCSQPTHSVNLVTDSMAAMGLGPGTYSLAGRPVIVDHSSARLEDETLAGSILTLDQACRNYARQTGCTLAHAIDRATIVPAAVLGIQRGVLTTDAPADIVLMDEQGHVKATFVAGECVHNAMSQ